MKSIALKKKYLIKESVSPASLHESYMILDPDNNALLAEVVEEATFKQKFAKLFVDKGFLPVKLVMRNDEGDQLLEISSPASFVKSVFTVKNSDGRILCVLRQKCSLIKPEILVEDGNGQLLGKIEGGWKFRNFKFIDMNQNEIATIRHLFAGITQELFTTADDYEVHINSDASMSLITLAAVICIDFMYHES
jgi:uncharacterized protein YxjI